MKRTHYNGDLRLANVNETVTLNNNGTEMTGAAVSVTQTYSKYGPLLEEH